MALSANYALVNPNVHCFVLLTLFAFIENAVKKNPGAFQYLLQRPGAVPPQHDVTMDLTAWSTVDRFSAAGVEQLW